MIQEVSTHLSIEQLTTDVTVQINDEFYKIEHLKINTDSDILDEGHPFLTQEKIK